MSHDSQQTTDHDVIRRWAEGRGGRPATVAATHEDDVGILRIAFDDDAEALDDIGWDSFFERFEREKLAFLYQDRTADGGTSRFFKFVRR